MSFDLCFSTKDSAEKANVSDIKSWFAARPHYNKDALKHNQGVYENEDTGVYFIFEFGECFDEESDPETSRSIQIVLLLNYLRPRFFALECAIEIQALVERFDLEVADPQEEQEEQNDFSEFDPKPFLNSYVKHNRQVTLAFKNKPEFQLKTVKSNKLEAAWAWNYSRRAREIRYEVDVFFPRIFWFAVKDKVLSGIVWTDGIPTVMPPTDAIVLHWEELARREMFGFKVGKPKQDGLYDRAALRSILDDFYKPKDEEGCLWPREFKRPPQLAKTLQSFDQVGESPQMLSSDAVIDDIFLSPEISES